MTETNKLTGNRLSRGAAAISVAALAAGCGDLVNPSGAMGVAYAPQGDVATFVASAVLMYDGKLEEKKASVPYGFEAMGRDESEGDFSFKRTLSGDGTVAAAASDTIDGSQGVTQRVAAFRVPSGERLMSVDSVLLRELLLARDGDLLAVLGTEGGSGTYDKDGQRVGFGGYMGVIQMYSTSTGALLWRTPTNTRAPGSFVFSGDGTRFFGNVVRVSMGQKEITMTGWDARTGQVLFSAPSTMDAPHNLVLWADGSAVMAATELGDGRYGFAWWSTDDGRLLRTLPQAAGFSNPNLVAVSPEGSFFASFSSLAEPDPIRPRMPRTTQVWRSDGTFLHAFKNDLGLSMVFSPDGTQIATLNRDGSVSIYRTIDGSRVAHRRFAGSVF